jgi:CRISPR-associated protein Cas2
VNILVTYDVNTETPDGARRLRKVAIACKNYGQRVQKSVFECQVDQGQYEALRATLIKIMDKKVDSIRLYRLASDRGKCVECYGVDAFVDFNEPLIL